MPALQLRIFTTVAELLQYNCFPVGRLPTWQVGFPGGSDRKESTCNVGDLGLIPGLGISPEEGNGYPSSLLAWRIPLTV